jgi:hypothetical protein
MNKPDTMMIDDVKYVREDSVKTNPMAEKLDGMDYCVVRTYSAGVHIGYVKEFAVNSPQQATLLNSRRLHYWDGAASLSQVALEGVNSSSRIAMELPEITLTDVVEIIPCSKEAADFFKGAKAWKK